MQRATLLTIFLTGLIPVLGCSNSDRPTTVRVSGTITFNGSPPPAAGTIYFNQTNVAAGSAGRPGSGTFDESGKYEAGSFEENDGLMPGTYRVRIECLSQSSGYIDDPTESYVPKDFQARDLVVNAEKRSVVFDIDVTP